jgi:putative ABC transport system permease protein
MSGLDPLLLLRTLAAILLLIGISAAALRLLRLRHPLGPALAVARGAVQLTVLALILSGIIADGRWVAIFLTVMFLTAVIWEGGRLGGCQRRRRWSAATGVPPC